MQSFRITMPLNDSAHYVIYCLLHLLVKECKKPLSAQGT